MAKNASQLNIDELKARSMKYSVLMVTVLIILSGVLLLGGYFYLMGESISWISFFILFFVLFMVTVALNLMRVSVEQEIRKRQKK